jgi:general secretion pathway protein L
MTDLSIAALTALAEKKLAPARRFLAWWIAELAACMPNAFKGAIERRSQTVEVTIAAGQAVFRERRGESWQQLARIGLRRTEEQAARRELLRVKRSLKSRRTRIVLALAESQVLRRTVELPAAASENLREVLGFEMDRHTPFKAEDVYFDHRVLGQDGQRKRMTIELLVVPRRVADRAMTIADALGIRPHRIGIAGEAGSGRAADLSRGIEAVGANPSARPGRRRLLMAAAAASVLLLLAPLALMRTILSHEEARLATLRAEATEVEALVKEAAALKLRNRFLVERKIAEPSLVAVLDELTRILPDETWAAELRFEDGRVSVTGYSHDAPALIGLVEASDFFSETQFSSPVVFDPGMEADRFDLLATVTGKVAK